MSGLVQVRNNAYIRRYVDEEERITIDYELYDVPTIVYVAGKYEEPGWFAYIRIEYLPGRPNPAPPYKCFTFGPKPYFEDIQRQAEEYYQVVVEARAELRKAHAERNPDLRQDAPGA